MKYLNKLEEKDVSQFKEKYIPKELHDKYVIKTPLKEILDKAKNISTGIIISATIALVVIGIMLALR